MELVHRVPITQYCDEAHLNPSERLELFVPVCNAIQHAHQKGIIHRDIKPSNVLVTSYDGKPVPKVIDFGIAKATDKQLADRTMFTEYGSIVGTLEYMSPEQASMSAEGIDARSDVYSLGVLLNELLTGSTPLDRDLARDFGYLEILKRIKEEETPRPRTRLRHSNATLSALAAQRNTEPTKLAKFLRGELDWIVMKALEKDSTRRYETPNGLARDIGHFLNDEPVEACPPSTRYRMSKLARKRRAALATVSMIAAPLLVGAAVSAWQAVRATRAERLAERRLEDVVTANARTTEALDAARTERDTALAERKRADRQTEQAKAEGEKARQSSAESAAVPTFFQDKVLAAARPEGQDGGLGRDVSILKAVDAAEPKNTVAFVEQPTVEASVRQV